MEVWIEKRPAGANTGAREGGKVKDIVIGYRPAPPRPPTPSLSDAAIFTMLNGGKLDPDAELVYRQHKAHADGHVRARVIHNIYGWCLFAPYWGGKRISENFETKELAEKYALEWVAVDPKKHHYYQS